MSSCSYKLGLIPFTGDGRWKHILRARFTTPKMRGKIVENKFEKMTSWTLFALLGKWIEPPVLKNEGIKVTDP